MPPQSFAVFRIATEAQVAAISLARDSGSHLALAISLWDAGCVEAAAGEFQALQRLNPGSEAARALARESARLAETVHLKGDYLPPGRADSEVPRH